MREGTWAEIVTVGAAGAVVFWLWHANRTAGAGTGVDLFPVLAARPGVPLAGAVPLSDVGSLVPGVSVSYAASPFTLPNPIAFNDGTGTGGGCNCGTGSTANTFGSNADLAAWLQSSPSVMDAARSGLTNWN